MLPSYKWWAEVERHGLAEWRGYWERGILQTPEKDCPFEVFRRLELISEVVAADADGRERLRTLEDIMRTWAALDQESEKVRETRRLREAGQTADVTLVPGESNSSSSGSAQCLPEEQRFDFERAKARASQKDSNKDEPDAKR